MKSVTVKFSNRAVYTLVVILVLAVIGGCQTVCNQNGGGFRDCRNTWGVASCSGVPSCDPIACDCERGTKVMALTAVSSYGSGAWGSGSLILCVE